MAFSCVSRIILPAKAPVAIGAERNAGDSGAASSIRNQVSPWARITAHISEWYSDSNSVDRHNLVRVPSFIGAAERELPRHQSIPWWPLRKMKMHNLATPEASPGLIREWIDCAARLHPDKPYIVSIEDGRTITFVEFAGLLRRIGSFLDHAGIGTNDRIALLAGNSIEHIACYVGVMAYGATICTVHVEMNRRHLGRILAQLKPRLALNDDDWALDDISDGTPSFVGASLHRNSAANSSPPPCGEGSGVGVDECCTAVPLPPDPPPQPSPTRGEGVAV